jgi:hypothetical protein
VPKWQREGKGSARLVAGVRHRQTARGLVGCWWLSATEDGLLRGPEMGGREARVRGWARLEKKGGRGHEGDYAGFC